MDEATRLRDYMLREKEEPEKTKEAAINYLKTLPLTNKEWLATIPDEEVYEVIKWLINYARVDDIRNWLRRKHDGNNDNGNGVSDGHYSCTHRWE